MFRRSGRGGGLLHRLPISPVPGSHQSGASAVQPPTEETSQEAAAVSYSYEPSPEEILSRILPRYIEAAIFGFLLESSASEHASRQRAMKAATDNAAELTKVLTRVANQARQPRSPPRYQRSWVAPRHSWRRIVERRKGKGADNVADAISAGRGGKSYRPGGGRRIPPGGVARDSARFGD